MSATGITTASLTPEQREKYTNLYHQVDKECGKDNGALNVAQFEELLVRCGLHCPRFLVANMFVEWDQNEDWRISLEEFLDEMEKMLFRPPPDTLLGMIRRKFLKRDVSKDGFLSYDELKSLVLDVIPYYSETELRTFYNTFDKDEDGKISFGEFIPIYTALLPVDSDDEEKGDDEEEETSKASSNVPPSHVSLWENIKRKFEESDLSKDGMLTFDELKGLVCDTYPFFCEDDLRTFYNSFDKDDNRKVNFEQFIRKYIQEQPPDSDDEFDDQVEAKPMLDGPSRLALLKSALQRKFAESDLDKDGFLTLKELKGLLSETYPNLDDTQVKEFLQNWDDDEDGKISLLEFVPMFINTMWDDSDAEEEEMERLEEEKKKKTDC